jgi:hypothetical protein
MENITKAMVNLTVPAVMIMATIAGVVSTTQNKCTRSQVAV